MTALATKSDRRPSAAVGKKGKAPAASLVGMRLWKSNDDHYAAAFAKAGSLSGVAEMRQPAAAKPSEAESGPPTPAEAGLEPVVVTWESDCTEQQSILDVDPMASHPRDCNEPHPVVMLVDGGLPTHVSPYPQRARDERRRDSDIIGYWLRIAGEREMPEWRDLDADQIAFFWPNSFLLDCKRGSHGRPLISSATRIVDSDGLADRKADITFTPPMVASIVRVSMELLESGEPQGQTIVFKRDEGEPIRCEVIALPLGGDTGRIDHVLCHVKLV